MIEKMKTEMIKQGMLHFKINKQKEILRAPLNTFFEKIYNVIISSPAYEMVSTVNDLIKHNKGNVQFMNVMKKYISKFEKFPELNDCFRVSYKGLTSAVPNPAAVFQNNWIRNYNNNKANSIADKNNKQNIDSDKNSSSFLIHNSNSFLTTTPTTTTSRQNSNISFPISPAISDITENNKNNSSTSTVNTSIVTDNNIILKKSSQNNATLNTTIVTENSNSNSSIPIVNTTITASTPIIANTTPTTENDNSFSKVADVATA
jgi:hypothetical protein